MKNVTVSLDDDSYHRARAYAAAVGRSLSALVRDHLNALAVGESEFDRLAREERELREKILAGGGGIPRGEWMTRDEAHDRAARRQDWQEHLQDEEERARAA